MYIIVTTASDRWHLLQEFSFWLEFYQDLSVCEYFFDNTKAEKTFEVKNPPSNLIASRLKIFCTLAQFVLTIVIHKSLTWPSLVDKIFKAHIAV